MKTMFVILILALITVSGAVISDEILTSQVLPGQSQGSQGLMVHSAN